MSRGFTEARFHNADGEVVDVVQMPTNRVFSILAFPSESAVVYNPIKDFVSIVKAFKPMNWFAYRSETYVKRTPSKGPGVDYDFQEVRIVARCAAQTKQGKHCRNEAEKGSLFCHGAHRPEKGTFPLVENDFLIDEFHDIAALGPISPNYELLNK